METGPKRLNVRRWIDWLAGPLSGVTNFPFFDARQAFTVLVLCRALATYLFISIFLICHWAWGIGVEWSGVGWIHERAHIPSPATRT